MSKNTQLQQGNRKLPKSTYLGRLCWLILSLLIVLLIFVGYVLMNPQWLSPLIEKQLNQKGIKTEIKQLEAQFATTTYQLSATMAIDASKYGVTASHANVLARVDWWDWIMGKPFVQSLSVTDTALLLSPEKLKTLLKPSDNHKDFSRYFPQSWQLQNTQITTYEQALMVSGKGESDHLAVFSIHDNDSGQVRVNYDKTKSRLQVLSERLDLQAFTGVKAILTDLSADINTQAWLGSRVTSSLDYQGVSARIQIDSKNPAVADENDGLGASVYVQSGQESLTVWLAQHGEQITARVHDADLSVISVLTPLLPKKLRFKKAQGKVSGVAIFSQKTGVESASLALQKATIFHQFGGLSNLNATVTFDKEKVKFFSRLSNSEVFLPTVFTDGIAPLTGVVEGDFELAKRKLTLSAVNVKNKDVESVKGRALIGLKEKFINIQANVANADASQTGRYLPEQLPLSVRKWLKKAIISGTATQTRVLVKGHYPQFIHRPENQLKINAEIDHVQLHYLDKNPDIIVKKGQLIIDGKKLQVEALQAEIFTTGKGQRLAVPITADTVIDNLLTAVVKVNARIDNQPVAKLQRIAQSSLAAPVLEKINRIVRAKGKIDVGLNLDIGVSKKNRHKHFAIDLQSPALSSVQLIDFPAVELKQVNLSMQANQTGLQTLSLTGGKDSMGRKMTIVIDRDKVQNYQAKITGRANVLSVLLQLKILLPTQHQLLQQYGLIRGASEASVQLIFDDQGHFKQIHAQSNLQGTAVSLFKLLTKGKQTRLPMTLSYETDKRHLILNLEKRLALELGLTEKGKIAGILIDNLLTKKAYQGGSKQIYYHGKSFDFMTFNRFRKDYEKLHKNDGNSALNFSKDVLDIKIDAVQWDKKHTTPLMVKGRLSDLNVSSPMLSGSVQYQKNQLNAQLSTLDVSKLFNLFQTKDINPVGREVTTLSLSKMLPQMQVQVDKVRLNGNVIGKGTIRSTIKNGLYSINQFLVTGKDFFFELSGYEKKESYGMTTHIQSDFKGENIAQIARLFKLNPVLDGKFIDVSANLSWPGKAHLLNLQKSYGDARLNAQNVKLTTMSAGVGSLFGLMDIVGILKRVTLDFKNLSSSKISFDTVSGTWNIGGGRALTKDMIAKGSLIDLKIVGPLDIYRRTFDNLEMQVIPKASNIIPIVGAVAGGVVGGVVGVLVQQVMGDTINQTVGVPYRVSGSWEAPKITDQQDIPKEKKRQKRSSQKKTIHNKPSVILEDLMGKDSSSSTIKLKKNYPSQAEVRDWSTSQKIKLESIGTSLILESLD